MKHSTKIIFSIFIVMLLAINLAAFEPHFMYDPTISADGEFVCFNYLNDLWLVSANGGTAQRLTATEGSESNPEFSPQGKYLAYNSNKDSFNGIYLMPATGGTASLISAEGFSFMDWFSDGKHILASKRNYQTGTEFYKLDLQGNYSLLSSWGGEFAKLSPDDQKIIFCKRGLPFREKYRGSVDGEIWEYDIAAAQYSRLTDNDFTERYPIYAPDGETIYFAAAVEDKFQIFSMQRQDLEQRTQLTTFPVWSARDFSLSQSGKLIYEYFDKLQIYDTKTGKSQDLEIKIAQDMFTVPDQIEQVKNKADKFAVSDDGKLLVFSYKYNLFAMPTEGGEVKQITFQPQVVNDIVILNDSKTVLYSGFADKTFQLFKFDIRKPEKIKTVKWSRDKYISNLQRLDQQVAIMYSVPARRGLLAVADSLAENIQEIVADEFIFSYPTLDQQKEYLAFVDRQQGIWSSRIFLYDLKKESKELLYFSNKAMYNIKFGLDNKSLLFTEDGEIKRLDLQARDDFYFAEDHWSEILEDEPVEAQKPERLLLDREGISQRIKPIIDRQGWNYIQQVISDSTFYYINHDDDKITLWSSNYSGENQQKIYSFKGRAEDLAFNAEQDCFYFTLSEELYKLDLKKKKEQLVANEFTYSYSEKKLNEMLFDRVWSEFGRGFYDPAMQGVNWSKLYKKYVPYLEKTTSLQHISSIVDEMIGEVNASHTGFYPRRDSSHRTYPQAALGLELDFSKNPKRGLEVKKVYHKSKLAKPFGIKPGDLLLSIDGQDVADGFAELLRNKVGQKLKLVFQTAEGKREVEIKGLSSRQNYQLYYENWVAEREQLVAELSDNKLGYLHIQSMNWTSYKKFEQDLFAKNYGKEALIIDVRNNGGGNIHDLLIETLTRQTYALNSHRGYDASLYAGPANTWEKPMVLLINQESFSDAEIFPNLFSELELGKVIGMPTSGSVIGTNHYRFRDGSSMRMPGHGWFSKDGANMEGSGAVPDIFVEPTPQQIIADDDVQLKRAVQELLKREDEGK